MASLLTSLFGGFKPSAKQVPLGDSDFADFAGAPDPSPAGFDPSPASGGPSAAASATGSAVPFTKWYNIHERHSLNEFKQEAVILAAIILIVLIHLWGTRTNRAKAKAWISAHESALEKEFALVGFGGRKPPSAEEVERHGLLQAATNERLNLPVQLLKEKSPSEFATYATGRLNVAFLDVNVNLVKRYSPLSWIAEYAISFFIDSVPAPNERMQAILYPFDGRETLTVPGQIPGASELRGTLKSGYDGFVWAIVSKDGMKQLREERYDVSITVTKDSPKLPNWVTVMSESAEVTEVLLAPELIKAVEQAGDSFEHLIVTDQAIDRPTKLEETVPKKRIYLSLKFPSSDYTSTLPIFSYFLRIVDQLASQAHFRPEVLRKVRNTREEFIRKLQKAEEEEKIEERTVEREKAKKAKRDRELQGLDSKAQKKYLEKEKEREMKRNQKRQILRA